MANRSLDTSRVSEHRRQKEGVPIQEYRRELVRAIKEFSVADQSFTNPPGEVIDGALRLLSGYEIDREFLADPLKNLLVLAISDSWLSTSSAQEKKNLVVTLKLLATDFKSYSTQSGRVREMSEIGKRRGKNFDPSSTSHNAYNERVNELYDFINRHRSESLSREAALILQDWTDNSILAKVRHKLGIVDRRQEASAQILVLDCPAEHMDQKFGFVAVRLAHPDGSQELVFPQNYLDFLEHEYHHLQQTTALTVDHQGLLFDGVTEALTERVVSHPRTYLKQRRLLDQILHLNEEYEGYFYRTLGGSKRDRKALFTQLVADFGLSGLLVIARLARGLPDSEIQRAVYIHPDSAAKLLGLKPLTDKPKKNWLAKLLPSK